MKSQLKTLRRNIFELAGNSRYSKPALNNLDAKLAKYLSFKEGVFIEVGGNDGYTQSNTYYLEKFLNWQGVLVEPIPELYKKCLRTRTRSYVYNCALVSNDFRDSSIEMHYANLMSVVDGSLKNEEEQRRHVEKGTTVQKIERSYSIKVPTRTLSSILDQHPGLSNIDFLSLDVEGYELNVLKGLNLDKYRPKYILVEAKFYDEVNQFLAADYELVEKMTHHDCLYRVKV
jgi:FkbM family methyltransferase